MSEDRKASKAVVGRLRREAPFNERLLWKLLRDRRLDGLKFRRQVAIGPYVADFLCHHHRLIVEADGPFHEDNPRDPERDAWLTGQGCRVLRFPNAMISRNYNDVLKAILRAVATG